MSSTGCSGGAVAGGQAETRAVYAAESASIDAVSRRFASWEELDAFVDDVTRQDWWRETFRAAPPIVRVDRLRRSATASMASRELGSVAICADSMDLATVLHELAHLAAEDDDHGRSFRLALLALVRRHGGIDAYAALRYEYSERGLDL